jgi:hypothetical protein
VFQLKERWKRMRLLVNVCVKERERERESIHTMVKNESVRDIARRKQVRDGR